MSSKNSDVDEVNQFILDQFPGEEVVLHSTNTIFNNNSNAGQKKLMYPPEYLHSINCSRLPLAKLKLKVGCPVIVLRNMNAAKGVYNRSRGTVEELD